MLTMIIADDEPVITKGLQILVDWQAMGIHVSGIYGDGESAMGAILRDRPDVALLDISMPGMDGIQILKNIHDLNLQTKVIFISGFQDFSYARSAVAYGAVDYLLKPVIKDELLQAVEKALGSRISAAPAAVTGAGAESDTSPAAVSAAQFLSGSGTGFPDGKLSGETKSFAGPDEDSDWIPVLARLIIPEEVSPQEETLLSFAWHSFLEEYMSEEDRGLFIAEEDVFIVFRNAAPEDMQDILTRLAKEAQSNVRGIPAFVVGERFSSLSGLQEAIYGCAQRAGELLFAEENSVIILLPRQDAETEENYLEELTRRRKRMIDNMLAYKQDSFGQDFEQFALSLSRAAAGRKDDAGFYFCSTVRLIEDTMTEHHITVQRSDMKELLEHARRCRSFTQMKTWFGDYYARYAEVIRSSAVKAGKGNIAQIKEYIDRHYRENLTLEVMAGEFYMNPYYFSAWFKKQTGTNYKDYLSYVRLQHAISFLLTSDMKAYEIAAEVGFSDARAFTDAFSRQYGETPSSYKKRIRAESGE